MYKKKIEQHFLAHTAEHLFGVVFVFFIAITVGLVASAETGSTTSSDLIPPTAPSSLTAQLSATPTVTLQWGASLDNGGLVAGYTINKIATGGTGGSIASIIHVNATTNQYPSYTDTSNLMPGSTISYSVVAIDLAGNLSSPSNVVSVTMPSDPNPTAPPPSSSSDTTKPTPPLFTLVGISGTQVNFSFTGASDNVGVVGYKLFKNGTYITFLPEGSAHYSDPSIQYGATYVFYAKAVDAAYNESDQSNSVNVTIPQSTANPNPTPVTPPSTSLPAQTTNRVAFSATVAPVTDCSGTKPMTEVFFVVSITSGGRFLLSSDNGITNAPLEWGKYSFPNGIYTWVAAPSSGFTVDTTSSKATGSFQLNGVCPKSTTTTTISPPSTSIPPPSTATTPSPGTVVPPQTSTSPAVKDVPTNTEPTITLKPVLRIFVDNIPVTKLDPSFNSESVELRVMVSRAKKVNFYAQSPKLTAPIQLGVGVVDDLLSAANADAWTFVVEADKIKEGTYKVFARVLRLDGTLIETLPVLVSINHQVAATEAVETYHVGKTDISVGSSTVSVEERTQILARVNDPSVCMSALECKVYCASHPEETERCIQFARVAAHFVKGSDVPSLTDNIPKERLTSMLADPNKRSRDIPLLIQNSNDLRAYCSNPTHADVCARVLLRNDLATEESLTAKKSELENARKEERKLLTDRTGVRAFIDTDSDGVSDYDEVNIYHTNPSDADTDHDGFSDGREIEAQTNPNGVSRAMTTAASATNPSLTAESSGTSSASTPSPSASEEVTIENPLLAGVVNKDLLSVTTVVAAETDINAGPATSTKKLRFSGVSLPNSYVTIFVFSDPIVVTIKTDASGAWVYTLDKELADGTHQVMSAITDGGGRILAKSEPLPFVKQAAAVSIGSDILVPTQQTPGFFSGASLYAFIAILIGLLGAAFSVIGFISHRRSQGDTIPPTA